MKKESPWSAGRVHFQETNKNHQRGGHSIFDLMPFKRRSLTPSVLSEMDDLTRKMWLGFPFRNFQEDMDVGWSPRLDVSETEDGLEVVADLQGLEKKDIQVSLDDGLRTIKGEKNEEKESKDKRYHTIERRSGSFYRAV